MEKEQVTINCCPLQYIANMGDESQNVAFYLAPLAVLCIKHRCFFYSLKNNILTFTFYATNNFPELTGSIKLLKNGYGIVESLNATNIAFLKKPLKPKKIVKINYINNYINKN